MDNIEILFEFFNEELFVFLHFVLYLFCVMIKLLGYRDNSNSEVPIHYFELTTCSIDRWIYDAFEFPFEKKWWQTLNASFRYSNSLSILSICYYKKDRNINLGNPSRVTINSHSKRFI